MAFPIDFLWGAATAAYQIEGSPLADGAGPSIWHRFAHTPGRTRNGDTGDVACDFYRRFPDDIRLMKELGLGAFRFSIAWGRILPEGVGRVNQAGLDFYRRVVDELLAHGITPCATLYHWDLPAALDDRGGWLNRDVARWFADYARIMFRALGDRVEMWSTINEPWVVADGGYTHSVLAPGHGNLFEGPIVAHNLLRAHGAAIQAGRAEGAFRLGLVVNLEPKVAASDRPEDLEATRLADAYMNRQYLDPVFLGAYPDALAQIYGPAWPDHAAADLDFIRQPLDWLGINYYARGVTAHDPRGVPVKATPVRQQQSTYTEMGWEVHAPSLYDALTWVKQRYGSIPLYVTENGAAFYDPPTARPGGVDDPLRVDYLRQHLSACRRAIADGVDLRGYFAWSLLDNLEWSEGFSRRFGIIHVDFATQVRTPKRSARFYADVIQSRGAVLEQP